MITGPSVFFTITPNLVVVLMTISLTISNRRSLSHSRTVEHISATSVESRTSTNNTNKNINKNLIPNFLDPGVLYRIHSHKINLEDPVDLSNPTVREIFINIFQEIDFYFHLFERIDTDENSDNSDENMRRYDNFLYNFINLIHLEPSHFFDMSIRRLLNCLYYAFGEDDENTFLFFYRFVKTSLWQRRILNKSIFSLKDLFLNVANETRYFNLPTNLIQDSIDYEIIVFLIDQLRSKNIIKCHNEFTNNELFDFVFNVKKKYSN